MPRGQTSAGGVAPSPPLRQGHTLSRPTPGTTDIHPKHGAATGPPEAEHRFTSTKQRAVRPRTATGRPSRPMLVVSTAVMVVVYLAARQGRRRQPRGGTQQQSNAVTKLAHNRHDGRLHSSNGRRLVDGELKRGDAHGSGRRYCGLWRGATQPGRNTDPLTRREQASFAVTSDVPMQVPIRQPARARETERARDVDSRMRSPSTPLPPQRRPAASYLPRPVSNHHFTSVHHPYPFRPRPSFFLPPPFLLPRLSSRCSTRNTAPKERQHERASGQAAARPALLDARDGWRFVLVRQITDGHWPSLSWLDSVGIICGGMPSMRQAPAGNQ
ncbi:hypothetical protein B0T21DRAFT_348090 [Apiosordaria backusii]|uniref:Uncharacterized protein n=1 Tax=Apiosordaria backusii TaxID=314023 RepID=A0AA40EDI6_9PEZI|nr:hypothetical protein B0T21DRAFT_348090 [Apiosordaria backusii]